MTSNNINQLISLLSHFVTSHVYPFIKNNVNHSMPKYPCWLF